MQNADDWLPAVMNSYFSQVLPRCGCAKLVNVDLRY